MVIVAIQHAQASSVRGLLALVGGAFFGCVGICFGQGRVMVPADAEIVIEGFAPVNKLEADGPKKIEADPDARNPNPLEGCS